MTRVVYVNGRYLPYAQAGVHVEDRGLQFADAIYEVCEVRAGALVDRTRHMERLERSLSELGIRQPMSRAALSIVLAETVRRNRVTTGLVYLQITRGIAVATMPDTRWARCDIKTVMLLPAVLAKEAAGKTGAQEAWFVDRDGFVTEGASSNAWIVDRDGTLITRALGPELLPGVTRRTLLDLLSREKIPLIERPFRVEEAIAAREAFVTSAFGLVMPVVRINGVAIGDGHPGDLTRRLRSNFHQVAELCH